VTSILQVIRENTIMELHRGCFDILLDDQSVGAVESHRSTEVTIEPGPHTLQVRSGRYSSGVHGFDVDDGQAIKFRCNGARIWPIYLASLVKTDLALTLKEE
jgi:hypothetical protein